jgi:putative hemolysin
MVEDVEPQGRLIATLRFQVLPTASADLAKTYSAQFYDLARLGRWPGAMLELGRFCVAPRHQRPRHPASGMGIPDAGGRSARVGVLFGCTSFAKADRPVDSAVYAALARHLGPVRLAARGHRARAFQHSGTRWGSGPGPPEALRVQSPLLQGYLSLGGWISDDAVIDRDLGTILAFTALEVAHIPSARQRLLRALVDATIEKGPDH